MFPPNSASNAADNTDAEFLKFVQQTVAEEVARAGAASGAPPAQVQAPPATSIPLTLNGQTYQFNSPEEVNRAVQNLVTAYSNQLATLQASQAQPAQGTEVTGKEEPAFDIGKFVEKMTTNPMEAFDYVDRARYGVDNPTEAVKGALKSQGELAEIKRVLAVYQFKDNHPEFPANPQTANLLYQIMQNQNLPFDSSGLESAYGQAVIRGFLPNPQAQQNQQFQGQQEQANYQQYPNQNYNQNQFNPGYQNYNFSPAPPPRVGRSAQDMPPNLAAMAEDMSPDQIEAVFRRLTA